MVQPPRQSCAGPSLLEMIWEQLMQAYDDLNTQQYHIDDAIRIQEASSEPTGSLQHAVDMDVELGRLKGICLGLATAISIIYNPYAPDVDAVRAECAERYDALG